MSEKHFGTLGLAFQQSLIKAIIEDKKFGQTIIDVIESKYFDNNSFRFIMENLKELYVQYDKIFDYSTLTQKIITESKSENSKVHLDTLDSIMITSYDDSFAKDTALNFCKQQNLIKELKKVRTIIDNGAFQEYSKIEEIIQTAMRVGLPPEDSIDVFHNIEATLEKNSRLPIPTGIKGLDDLLKGGLARGELGVILAPTGIGKSTLITKFANSAFNVDFNVLQVFFEDNLTEIKKKHYTIWSEISSENQSDRKDEVIPLVEAAQTRSKGSLDLLKLPSDSVTMTELKNRVRKHISDGKKVDLLLIDYVDCITAERVSSGEEWKGEGNIMRKIEAMCDEFNIAIWVATQGNRESISSEVVTTDQMGGSIKKAQIGHVVISVGKTMPQKEHKLATMTLLKSRVGRDGVIFQNCEFNNEYLKIDTDTQTTFLGHEEQKVKKNQERINELLGASQANKNRV